MDNTFAGLNFKLTGVINFLVTANQETIVELMNVINHALQMGTTKAAPTREYASIESLQTDDTYHTVSSASVTEVSFFFYHT